MAHDHGVILDIDGTLIDSNDVHARAWVDAGREFGYDFDFADVRPLIGMGGDRVLPMLTGLEEDSPEGERLTDRRGEIFRGRYLSDIRAFPRVRDFVERLADDGFDRVVATSASEEDLSALLDAAGVADLIRAATSSGDAEDSKPAGDIVEAAIARANVDRERLVMIGDTPYDVEAARRAHVPIIAVRSGGWDAPDLDGAVSIHDDIAGVLEDYERLFLERRVFGRSG